MAFTMSPAVDVETDAQGVVRGLSHPGQPYRPLAGPLNGPALAEAYLRDVSAIYGIEPTWLGELSRRPSEEIEEVGTELRLARGESVTGTTTVSFQQTHFGLPIWEAGFTVSMLSDELRVTSSLSTLHADVVCKMPKEDAHCARGRITARELAELLDLGEREEPSITSERSWVHRYQAAERIAGVPRGRGAGLRAIEPPTLKLPAVSEKIEDGRHYVVTEVLFELPLPSLSRDRPLLWRVFVEVNTCSVLYLRCLIAPWTGGVYLTDPPSATGSTSINACSPASELDPLRTEVTLEGLTPASPQGLTGTFVTAQQGSGSHAPPTLSSPNTDFAYSVSEASFAATCAYFHVDALFRLIESFGYTPISEFFQNTALPLPVYFLNFSYVNSFAVPNSTANGFGAIECGLEQEGCPISIAVDWRVSCHEFVHGMLFDRIHSGFLGFAHNGGDGFGAIFMDPASKAPDRFLTFPWVPLLASASDPSHLRRHDRDVTQGWAWGGSQDDHAYRSEQILSTTLFRIYRSTGGDSAYLDKRTLASRFVMLVMTRAMASLPLSSTTPITAASYATTLINADAGLSTPWEATVSGEQVSVPGGAIGKIIRWSFEEQGLYQSPGAPTPISTRGAPPAVDVYINDSTNGEYQYQEDFWDNTNIWNLLSPKAATSPSDHETPVVGQTNYAYVDIGNRGTEAATDVVVSGYHCRPSAGLLWPDDWQAMTTASITVPGTIAPGATTIVGPFEWMPSEIGHECMMMSVSTAGDLSNADSASGLPCATGPTPHWRLVPFDNNLGQRNVAPVAGGGGLKGLATSFAPRRFWAKNPYPFEALVQLEVKLPSWLAERGWRASFANPGGDSFTLPARGSRAVLLQLDPGEDFAPDEVPISTQQSTIVVRVLANSIPIGGMHYSIDPKLKAPPRETAGHHDPDDECKIDEAALLDCLLPPKGKVKSLRVRRITVDIDFEDKCD